MALTTKKSREPIYDRKTLERVHDVWEFEAKTERAFDRWLHEQIMRARKQRELTPAERKGLLT